MKDSLGTESVLVFCNYFRMPALDGFQDRGETLTTDNTDGDLAIGTPEIAI
jgi:hypothetical protein